ncbi:MAG: hypothetical protein COB98_03050 [Flavobacteriaceae bacterium]|nr:MAG: hypothetical protein COB98_03050 [Flavobacteriaceae bacterium]
MPQWPIGKKMTNLEINSLVNNPQQISVEKTEALEAILKEYPYFQAARALHLKGLQQQKSYKYNQALKITAAHTSDRSVLFDFITTTVINPSLTRVKEITTQEDKDTATVEEKAAPVEALNIPAGTTEVTLGISSNSEQEPTKTPTIPSSPIRGFNPVFENIEQLADKKQEKSSGNEARFSDIIFPAIGEEESQEKVKELIEKTEEVLQIGSPLEFSKKEEHSFSEWMNLTEFPPLPQEKSVQKTVKKTTRKIDSLSLIDKFIASKPKIPRIGKSDSKQVKIHKEAPSNDRLMTETLAKVYLEQEKYGSAIKAYRILSLKYPEKSSFFADRIKAIKYLQKNKS